MGKRLSFLCVILVLSLSAAVQAQAPITVVNPSFEWADEVNQVSCHVGLDGVLGWSGGAELGAVNPDWSGVDVNCGVPGMCEDCRDWHVFPDGNVVCYLDMGTFGYQLTDHTITAGYKYTLTFDSMTWWSAEGWSQPIRASYYYLSDPCTPDVCHIELSQTVHIVTGYEHDCGLPPDNCLDDWEYDLTASFVAETGAGYLGEKLGIKFGSPWAGDYPGSSWAWLENVRLAWDWATEAYNPSPEDGEELVTKNPTLTWKPGVYADQHEVYFGTDETAVANADNTDTTGIYKSTQDPCSYTPAENPLELGKTYYWKITEVNTGYVGPLSPPWEGDVWSYRVEGHASSPYPEDGETDVIFLGLQLSWTAGAEAENHVVYFGTDAQAVEDANTNSPEYKTTFAVGTETYSPGALTVNRLYYWRIDEKSNGGAHTIKGDVWMFQVGMFLIADNFESYTNNPELYTVWDDYWVNGSDGEIFLETDPNIIREPDSNAAMLRFYNVTKKFPGSQFDVQDLSELDIGSDWTIGGVKALFMYLRGDPCNAQAMYATPKGVIEWAGAQPWVELESTDSNSGHVLYSRPEMTAYDGWFGWNIDLGIFDACGVTLSAIDRFTIGIGGAEKTGQTKAMEDIGNIYVDDIRLYPSRCRPEMGKLVGDFGGGDEGAPDCNVDYKDLDILATDWGMQDGDTLTENRPATLTGFPDETSHWTTDCAVGTGAIDVNNSLELDYDITVNDPRLVNVASMSITAWIKPIVGMEKWVGVVSSREEAEGCGDDASEIGVYGAEYGGPDGLGYDWSCGTEEWEWDAGVDITDGVWTFIALSVDPCGATLYKRETGGNLQTGIRNEVAHSSQKNFADHFVIGSDDKGGYFKGAIDDVRLYAYALDWNDVNHLAFGTGDPNPAPVYRYEFDETTGYTAADTGTPTYVYGPVQSVANITDPEPKLQRFLNFHDYALFADNWMKQRFWPEW
ncbi:MAG: LamG domain-containing protein [Planctomycetota bacterium]|nr:MAG: LamG domain-containing protein [Planctomycetota bacterium]